jgi:tetratricopeptide (TPR) repeat protein
MLTTRRVCRSVTTTPSPDPDDPVAFPRPAVNAQQARGVQVGESNVQINVAAHRRTLPVPRQLPPDVSNFTGRRADLAMLNDLLTDAAPTMVISTVAGTAGVGKTALAVHWAHRIRDRFPDGDLYTNLRAYDPGPPATPTQVLSGFLRALDVAPENIPPDVDAQTALFRSVLHDRRILIVLDNARDPEQVRPLLPNSAGSLVVITSRSNLSGLIARDGARRITLDMLPQADAVELLSKIVGFDRVRAEPQAVATIASRCVYLPLALRIAAELAASRSHAPLRHLAAELNGERQRLESLAVADDETMAVRSVFFSSYRALPDESARGFRLLGLHPGADFCVAVAAALVGCPVAQVRRVLAVLTNSHLLEEAAFGRYRFHDLLRDYAAERAEHDEDRHAAVHRSLEWYLHTAEAAARILGRPSRFATGSSDLFPTYADALAWFETELDNLVAATRQAARLGAPATTAGLVEATRAYFQLSMVFDAFGTMADISLAAARLAGDRLEEAETLHHLGAVENYRGRLDEALAHFEQGVDIFRDLDRLEAIHLVDLAGVYCRIDRLEEASAHLGQAVALARGAADPRAEGHAYETLSLVELKRGNATVAAGHAERAVEIFRRAGSLYGEGIALGRLAMACLVLERLDDAIRYGNTSIAITGEVGYRIGQAWSLTVVAAALHDTGQPEAAREHWQRALDIYQTLGHDEEAERIRVGRSTGQWEPGEFWTARSRS